MTKKSHISDWAEKINWQNRVKAVCKPCWELKYCPYGPLVEDFPLKPENDEQSCRIFGHDCPVFHVAEPFTETKELRRISRSIPRTIQFKVLKRENQICDECGQTVRDADVEFDHIIPWSKGGPTEEHNIRLLCKSCNRKKGNKFEDEHLVKSFTDHVTEPHSVEVLEFFKIILHFGHNFQDNSGQLPNPQDFADGLSEGELTAAEHQASDIFKDFVEFFDSERPSEIKPKEYEFLRLRWGFTDSEIYSIEEAAYGLNLDPEDCVQLERLLFNRLGIRIKNRKSDLNKWLKK